MFLLYNGDIIPGVRIGKILLGMSKRNIEEIFNMYNVSELEEFFIYEGNDIKVWIHKEKDIVTQILVFGEFKGKLMNIFGIGSYISDIEKKLNAISYEERYVYLFSSLKGICFELQDIEEDWDDINWYKANAPIESISVFSA